MFLILQIALTILSALCVAAVVPVGALVDWGWGAFFGFLAILFFVFMKICKTQVEINNAKNANSLQSQKDTKNDEETEKKQ